MNGLGGVRFVSKKGLRCEGSNASRMPEALKSPLLTEFEIHEDMGVEVMGGVGASCGSNRKAFQGVSGRERSTRAS